VESGSLVFEVHVLCMGTVLSPSLSAALHMASVVVGGVTEGRGAGKGPGIFTNGAKDLNDEKRVCV